MCIRDSYRRAAPAGTDEATVEALRDYGRDYYREHCTGLTRVYDGVPALLQGLAERGIALGMVTNKTEATAQRVMAHYFPEVPFRFIWGNNGVRPLKPAPESGKLMLRELGLTPEQIAFTGDGDTDMAFASALGFWALGASWGYRPRPVQAEHGADALLEPPAELQKLLLGYQKRPAAQTPPLSRGGLCGRPMVAPANMNEVRQSGDGAGF